MRQPSILFALVFVLGGCDASKLPPSSSPPNPPSLAVAPLPTPSSTPGSLRPTPATATIAPSRGIWEPVGSLATARHGHSATLLADGRVLVAGGDTGVSRPEGGRDEHSIASAETYEPTTRRWTTIAPMHQTRHDHTATLLRDGRVLVAGGERSNFEPDCAEPCQESLASTELFDPTTNTWSEGRPMKNARGEATAVRLSDGRVLVAGGFDHGGQHAIASGEIFDPVTNTWSMTAALRDTWAANSRAPLVLLPDGSVLAVGGQGGDFGSVVAAEIYRPSPGTWTRTGVMPRGLSGTASRLLDGRVLFSGHPDPEVGSTVGSAIFDPASGSWTPAGTPLTARSPGASVTLLDGRVMLVGGAPIDLTPSVLLVQTVVYDAGKGTWSDSGSLTPARDRATLTLLADGTALFAGGLADGGVAASAEIWIP